MRRPSQEGTSTDGGHVRGPGAAAPRSSGRQCFPPLAREPQRRPVGDSCARLRRRYNALLNAQARCADGSAASASAIFDDMRGAGFRPDSRTYRALIMALGTRQGGGGPRRKRDPNGSAAAAASSQLRGKILRLVNQATSEGMWNEHVYRAALRASPLTSADRAALPRAQTPDPRRIAGGRKVAPPPGFAGAEADDES